METKDINVAEKKTRGRPKKYATDEERKKAKTVKTVESNKRKKVEKISGTGMIKENPDLTKSQINKIVNFITKYKNTKKPDPKFKKYVEEDIGEDNIVSRFADTILEAEISKITEEDKNDLIPDLYDYVKHFFPDYQDTDLNLDKLHKMRSKGNGLKGGKLITTPPQNPLTETQGREILEEIQSNAGMLLPVSQARQFQLKQAIERIGGFSPIEDMRQRFDFFITQFLHPSQHSKVMRHYDKILALTSKKRKIEGGKIPYQLPEKNTTNLATLSLTDEQGQNIFNRIIANGAFIYVDLTAQRNLNSVLTTIQRELSLDDITPIRSLFIEFLSRYDTNQADRNTIMRYYDRILNYREPSAPKKKKRVNDNDNNDRNVTQRLNMGEGLKGGAVKRPRERSPSPIRPLTQAQGNAVRDALHNLNAPITPQMVSHFGSVVANIGERNLRTRFQMFLEGFTHPPSVVRFMNRFDRLLRLVQDEGAETDTEGAGLLEDLKKRELSGKHSVSKNTIEKLKTKSISKLAKKDMDKQMDADIYEQFDGVMNRFLEPKGKGLIAGYTAEAPNGLSHIYPLSHAHILKICKHLV